MKSYSLLFVFSLGLILSSCTQTEKTCVITGKVINRPQSNNLILTKSFEDFRSQTAITIPITDSTFTHTINFKDAEAYALSFEDELMHGSWRPIKFFTTNDTIKMVLHPMNQWEENTVEGGEENKQYQDYEKKRIAEINEKTAAIRDSMSALRKNGNYYNQRMDDINETLRKTEKQGDKQKIYDQINEMYQTGEGYSPEAKKLNEQYDSIMKIMNVKEFEHIKSNITIDNYYRLIESILNTEYFHRIF